MNRSRTKIAKPMSPAHVRCAIYTRTSSDERLNSDFNSLDAQQEACAHYISSRKGDGWVALKDAYSDGGFSGKNTERPAIQRLLNDVRAGKVDAVVIYKLDRISRSLRDFLSLLSIFEEHSVACVSISQSFDTKSAMGRLMMNVLLSFAEFEREVIGERIRDKIAASRHRGKWTGGTPILGYDVDRSGPSPKLVVNPTEASRVLAIFTLYLEMGSLLSVAAELNRRGWRGKSWVTRDGRERGGEPFDKTRLSVLLKNPLYIGKIKHKGAVHTGEHEAIITQQLFDRVQRLLERNGRGGPEHRNKHGALLRGLLRCKHCDCSMTHTFSGSGPRRYRYYCCLRAMKRGRAVCPTRSVPAAEIEKIIVDEVRAIGRDPRLIKATVGECKRQRDEQLDRLGGERRTIERGITRLRAELAAPDVDPARVVEVSRQIDAATQRIAEIDSAVAGLQAEVLNARDVANALTDFDKVWMALQPKEQARVVRLVVQQVTYDGPTQQVSITFSDIGITTLVAETTAKQEDAA